MTEVDIVRQIHEESSRRKLRIFVVATGAGAGVQKWLWETPGCSSYFVGASFPYSMGETDELLGFKPDDGYASEENAVDMAMVAYQRACDGADVEPIGLAMTASVASVRAHRSEHRVHMACMTRHVTLVRTVVLEKGVGAEARMKDGVDVDRAGLRMLQAAIAHCPGQLWLRQPHAVQECLDGFMMARARFFMRPAFDRGRRHTLDEVRRFDGRPLLPGAFNPPHAGHEKMADVTTAHLGREPVFSVCSTMPAAHKGDLTVQDMLERARALRHRSVIFTEGDPLFIDKARAFPGRPIVIGADALARLLDPQWGADPLAVLGEMQKLGTTLFVFDRPIDGHMLTGKEVLAKAGYAESALAAAVVTSAGEGMDVSSTALREGRVTRTAKGEEARC